MEQTLLKLNVPDAKRVWFITDTHLGIKNNSNEWIEVISQYFFSWFIPLVKKNYKKGDILIHLGDVYDSRQSINIKVLNLGINIFESLSEVFNDGIYVIAGNHDLWGKTSNEINSLKSLKWIPNVNILEEPESLTLGRKNFFLMPWRKDHDAERDCLNNITPHDYLCCHTDVTGMKFNKYVNIDSGVDSSTMKKFGKVYSGHIHYSQDFDNIKMLGSPYELTRSDLGNPKGITMLDLQTEEETFFKNDFSPKFKRFNFENVLEMTIEEADALFSNNFVDIMVDSSISFKAPLNVITDNITSPRKISFHPFDPNQNGLLTEQFQNNENRTFSVMDFIDSYVSSLDYDVETKSRLLKSIAKLHKVIVAGDQETNI